MHWDHQIIIATHGVEEKGHTATALSGFAKSVIDFAGIDDGVRVSSAHPVDGGVYFVVRNVHAVTDYHRAFAFFASLSESFCLFLIGIVRNRDGQEINPTGFVGYYPFRLWFMGDGAVYGGNTSQAIGRATQKGAPASETPFRFRHRAKPDATAGNFVTFRQG